MHVEADRIPALMDMLGIEKAHFLGHSDGASIALITAARTPKRVASLHSRGAHVLSEPLTIASIAAIAHDYETTDLARRWAATMPMSTMFFAAGARYGSTPFPWLGHSRSAGGHSCAGAADPGT